MAKKHHPDVNKKDDQMFKMINEAYQVLGDSEIKKSYDATRLKPKTNYDSTYTSNSNSYDYHYGHG
jgi:curved DNA-binding protein CbpA